MSGAMAVWAVGVKIVMLPFPVANVFDLIRYSLRLAIVVAPDVCFVVALTAVAAGLGRLVQGFRPLAAAWCAAFWAVFATAAMYCVASLSLYHVLMVPLSVRLLSFVGGAGIMASSIKPYLTPGSIAGLVLAPLSIAVAPLLASRFGERTWLRPWRTRWLVLTCVLVSAYGAVCHAYVESHWTDSKRWERRIAYSAHATLLASCAQELVKNEPLTISLAVQDPDDSDFRHPVPAQTVSTNPWQVLGSRAARPKNVILIVLESTGVEYLGLYGSKYDTTPCLNKLVERQGVVFDNIYTQATSSCKSLVCLTASVYPRFDWLLICRDRPKFDVPTIMQALRGHGYRSCFAHAGYWSYMQRDRYLGDRAVDTLIDGSLHPGAEVNSWGIHDRMMYQDVLDWIDAGKGKPFFAFAYTIETHHPYVAPVEDHDFGVKNKLLGRYLNAVRAADAHIAWLIDQLDRRGLADSTVVAITSDHGESFGQHGQELHNFGLYEQGIHVPLIVLYPGLADVQHRNLDTVGQHIDIPATIADLVGIPAPQTWQGRSLLAARRSSRAYLSSVGNEVLLGVRDGRFKYHYYFDSKREELFDIVSDPAESNDLALQDRARCRQYRRRVAGLVLYQREFLQQHGG